MEHFIELHIKRLPLHISCGMRDHIKELQQRVPLAAKDENDTLACIIISAKVLDDENEYNMNFWTAPHTYFTINEIKKLESNFLKKINWRASILNTQLLDK